MKLLTAATVLSVVFSATAFAGDASYPGAIERGTYGSPQVGTPDYPGRIERGNSQFDPINKTSVPPTPDSETETQHSDGSISVSKTYIRKR